MLFEKFLMTTQSLLSNAPSFVEKDGCKFLIMDAPTDDNLKDYIQELKRYGVRSVCRACEPSYGIQPIKQEGMAVVEIAFADGAPPSDDIINKWLTVVDECKAEHECVAVHCVAGLGRAPVLVAIALMEFCSMDALSAIDYIRRHRRGAINQRQLLYLKSYKLRRKNGCCIIL